MSSLTKNHMLLKLRAQVREGKADGFSIHNDAGLWSNVDVCF